jgi:hypothetical protein
VFLDREWDRDAKVALAGVMAETIKAAIAVVGSMGLYDIVLEPGLGGLYYTESLGEKRLFMSWARYLDAPLG